MSSASLGSGIITSLDRMSLDNKLIEVFREVETKKDLSGEMQGRDEAGRSQE